LYEFKNACFPCCVGRAEPEGQEMFRISAQDVEADEELLN